MSTTCAIGQFPKKRDEEPIQSLQEYLQKEKEEIERRLTMKIKYNVCLDDFDLLVLLGSGSFGKVVLSKHKESENFYAIKVMSKKNIVDSRQIEHSLDEKKVLESFRFPVLVYLECFFQDNTNLYFVMPYHGGGDLFSVLRKHGRFDESIAKFYSAQVLLGLEYMHYLDFAYRDLKPENLLIDAKGYVKITDFGFCKLVKGRTWTLCGTPEYLAPEIILSKGYGKSVDWWSFGVLLFEMCSGHPPFYSRDHLKLYEKIVHGKYRVASHFSTELIDILENILQVDLTKRFGNLKNGVTDIKQHSWFKFIQWRDVLNGNMEPPFVPRIKNPRDFPVLEKISMHIAQSDLYNKEFACF